MKQCKRRIRSARKNSFSRALDFSTFLLTVLTEFYILVRKEMSILGGCQYFPMQPFEGQRKGECVRATKRMVVTGSVITNPLVEKKL